MASWKDDPFSVPLWSERPKCHCGFRCWMVTIMDSSDRCYDRRCFKCPNLDSDFVACTFLEWIDKPGQPVWPISPQQTETKDRYMAREAERQALLQRECRVRQQQFRLDGMSDQLRRRYENLNAQEAELKRREEELQHRQDALRDIEQREKEGSSSKSDKKGKKPRYTQ